MHLFFGVIEISKIIYYFLDRDFNNGFAEVKGMPLKTSVISIMIDLLII